MSQGILTPDVGPDEHAQGPANAPVTLVEYGDYECPQCGPAYLIVRQLQQALGPALRFVFRSFPLSEAHPNADRAAEAAESVAAHGGEEAFWDLHDILFENQDALEDSDLLGYAAAVGVDERLVAEDLATRACRTRVRTDLRSGDRSGVTATPAFFVNGRRYGGDWTNVGAFVSALQALAPLEQTSRR